MSVFTVLNPATEEPVTTVAQASAEETDEAIARAAAALPAWRAVAPGDRARLLRSFAAAGGRGLSRSSPTWRSRAPGIRSGRPDGRLGRSATC